MWTFTKTVKTDHDATNDTHSSYLFVFNDGDTERSILDFRDQDAGDNYEVMRASRLEAQINNDSFGLSQPDEQINYEALRAAQLEEQINYRALRAAQLEEQINYEALRAFQIEEQKNYKALREVSARGTDK